MFIKMTKKHSHCPKLKKKYYPLVSVCTPTFNRRPFIPTMLDCFNHQTYPKDRIEWIIVDDGTDKVRDLIEAANVPQIKYFELPNKLPLGAKRNYMHTKCTGSIIVYMDDDDYYPPQRIEHAVDMLNEHRNAMCAGSSEIYIYFKHIKKMIQCGPYGPNHATAGTFAFRAELLKNNRYNDDAALAEERAFLKDYTVPFVQLDPLKTILVFSHEHNTFDKRRLLDNPHPDFLKESPKTVDMFIKGKDEAHIKKFFMEDIDKLLEKYEPGEPKMKPDVLKQIKEIEKDRARMVAEEQAKNGQIIMQQPGQQPIALNPTQVVELIKSQQAQLEQLSKNAHQLEQMNHQLQQMLISRQQEIMKLNTENSMLKKAFGPQQVANDLPAFNANAPQTVSSDYPIINPIFDIPSNTASLNKSTPRFTITNPNLL
jgi:glycosyltransferase involved in cell wall biosynthesis